MKIRKNDNVLVIGGKDQGKKGKVRFAYPKKNRIIVEGINFIKKHSRAKGQVRQALRELGIPWDPRGAGWAVSQEPPPGTPMSEVARCSIVFASKVVEESDEPEALVAEAG